MTRVVSGFPGIEKTTLFDNGTRFLLLDSDSSTFSWADPVKRIRNPEWPQNYLRHILQNIGKVDEIFVSSHAEVRTALVDAGIKFTLVYPGLEMKEEYVQRYVSRGNAPAFVTLLQENYDAWITELMQQEGCTHIVLKPGQYLSDVLFIDWPD